MLDHYLALIARMEPNLTPVDTGPALGSIAISLKRIADGRCAAPRPGRVSESIWSGSTTIIPLADVQFIEKLAHGRLQVVFKNSTWDSGPDGGWNSAAKIGAGGASSFLRAWCHYRSELEADTLADLSPGAPAAGGE